MNLRDTKYENEIITLLQKKVDIEYQEDLKAFIIPIICYSLGTKINNFSKKYGIHAKVLLSNIKTK